MRAYFDRRDGTQRQLLPLGGDRLTLGSATDNDLIIDERSVAGVHAIVYQLNGGWFIEDCGSKSGTVVNGRRLTSLHPLRPGDHVRLGRAQFHFGQLTTPTDAEPERMPNGDHQADRTAVVVADPIDSGHPEAPWSDPNRCPYPGLAPFDRADADLFFGRADIVERCLKLLDSERFVALVGATGSGKSSVLRAGLVAQLPDTIVLEPGEHPRRSLAQAGVADRPNAVLVVDQLEEVVTRCQDHAERAAFLETIVDHPGGLAVAVRADCYGEFATYPEIALLLAAGQVLLGPLSREELVRVVTEPARRCGVAVEAGLPEIIASEIGNAPGALPLLGHALRESWERRDGDTITVAGYREVGGVHSAISESAEAAFAALDGREQAVARRLLMRMVDVRADGVSRRWLGSDQMADHPARGRAARAAFAAARLVVVDGDRSTFTHEAVLSEWPRLAGWIAEERAALVAGPRGRADRRRLPRLRLLAGAMSLLVVLSLVVGVVAVAQRNDANRDRDTAQLVGLLEASQAARTAQPDLAMLLAAEAHAESATPGAAGALVGALAARPSAHHLLTGARSAVQALALGSGVVATASGNEVRLWTEDGWRPAGRYPVGDNQIFDLAISPDGETLVAAVPDGRALVAVDAPTGRQLTEPVSYGALRPVGVFATGNRALVLLDDVLDPTAVPRVEQRELRSLDRDGPSLVPPQGRLVGVAAPADGGRAALVTDDGVVWLADLQTGAVTLGAPAPIAGEAAGIDDLAWHDDLIVAGRVDGSVDAWRVDPGGQLVQVGHYAAGSRVEAVASGCDGTCVAAGTADGRVVAWGISPDRILFDAPHAHDGRVNDVEVTADGESVVSGGDDRVGAVHALDGSLAIAPLLVSGGTPARGAYHGDSAILHGAGSAERGQVIRWSDSGHVVWRTDVDGVVTWLASTDHRAVALVAPADAPKRLVVLSAMTGETLFDESLVGDQVAAAVSPDGSTIVLATLTGSGTSFFTVDLGNPFMSSPIDVEDRVLSIAYSPDGGLVVTGHAAGDVALRRSGTFRAEQRSEAAFGDAITAVGFTPDGGTALAGGLRGTVRVFDAATLEERFGPLEGHRGVVSGVAANDRYILTTSDDGTIRMWDLADGGAIGGPIPIGGTTFPSIALRSDGERALVQAHQGLLELIVDADEWARLACSIAGRELTGHERARYGIDASAGVCTTGT